MYSSSASSRYPWIPFSLASFPPIYLLFSSYSHLWLPSFPQVALKAGLSALPLRALLLSHSRLAGPTDPPDPLFTSPLPQFKALLAS